MASSELFDVVFDITKSKAPDLHVMFFGIGLGCLIALVLFLTRRKGWWAGLAFAAFWAVVLGYFTFPTFHSMRSAVSAGRCERG